MATGIATASAITITSTTERMMIQVFLDSFLRNASGCFFSFAAAAGFSCGAADG